MLSVSSIFPYIIRVMIGVCMMCMQTYFYLLLQSISHAVTCGEMCYICTCIYFEGVHYLPGDSQTFLGTISTDVCPIALSQECTSWCNLDGRMMQNYWHSDFHDG